MTERPHLVSVGPHNETELIERDRKREDSAPYCALDIPLIIDSMYDTREVAEGLRLIESELPRVRIHDYRHLSLLVERDQVATQHSGIEDIKFMLNIYLPGVELGEPRERDLQQGEVFYGIKR